MDEPMEFNINTNAENSEELISACGDGNIKNIEKLLELGANPNYVSDVLNLTAKRVMTPLVAAAKFAGGVSGTPKMLKLQSTRMIKLLMRSGASISQCEKSFLEAVLVAGNIEVLMLSIDNGIDIDKYAFAFMSIAISHGYCDVLESLKKLNISPNIQDGNGSTAFLSLCGGALSLKKNSQWECVKDKEYWYLERITQLINSGIDINMKDKVGATPLMRAIVTGQWAIAKALILAGANIEESLENGVSTLHLASSCANHDFIAFYLSYSPAKKGLLRMKIKKIQPDVKALISNYLTSI